jgi:hypothetical protein
MKSRLGCVRNASTGCKTQLSIVPSAGMTLGSLKKLEIQRDEDIE